MILRCVVLLLLGLFAEEWPLFASSETSEEAEEVASPTVSPAPARKSSPGKGEPQVETGTTKSTSSRSDGGSIARPPARLSESSRSPAPGPSSNFLIAIDVGHTKNKFGAVSARGVTEYTFNRRLAGELFSTLQSAGQFRSLLINPDGGDIGLVRRAQVANERGADLFLAIHHDSVKDTFLKEWQVDGKPQKYCDDFHGYSVFFSRKNVAANESRAFALQLGEAMLKAGFTPTLHHVAQEHRPIIDPAKGVYAFDDLLVLKNAKMPAALLECGVIVNRQEEQDLNSQKNRGRMITAIHGAIATFADTTERAVKKE